MRRSLWILALAASTTAAPAVGRTFDVMAASDRSPIHPVTEIATTGFAPDLFGGFGGDLRHPPAGRGRDVIEIAPDGSGTLRVRDGIAGETVDPAIHLPTERQAAPARASTRLAPTGEDDVDGAPITAIRRESALTLRAHGEPMAAGEPRGRLAEVPLPGAMILLGSALIGLAGVRPGRAAAPGVQARSG